jgi:hypothetical protein
MSAVTCDLLWRQRLVEAATEENRRFVARLHRRIDRRIFGYMASLIKFLRNLYDKFAGVVPEEDKYRIIERGNGTFSAQVSYWNGWRDIKDSPYQSVCYEAIQKQRIEDEAVEQYKTIKRVIKV